MTRTLPQRFLRTAVTSYGSALGGALIALVMTPVLARSLGTERFGVWSLVLSLSVYGDFLQLGVTGAATKEVAEGHVRRDVAEVRRVVSTTWVIFAVLAGLSLLLAVVLGLAFDPIFSVPHGLAIDAAVLMFLTGLVTSLSLLGDTAVAALAGLQRYDLLNLTLLLLYALQAIGWVIALALHTGLVGLGVGSVCAAVVFLAVRVRYAHKLLPEFDMNASHADRATARRLTSLSVWLAVSQASWLVLVQIDVLVVGLVAGVPAAGIYAVGQKLATAVDRLTRPAMTGFFTHAAQLTARDDQSGLGKSLQAGIRLGLGIGMPFAIAIALFAEPAVRAWAGRSYTDAALVVVYLALANVVLSAVRPGFMLLGGSGRARSAALLAASEALLNLGLSIALGLWIGLTGVALGTLIATIAVRGCVSLPYIGRTFGVDMLGLVRTVVTAHAAPSAAAVALALLIRAAALPDLVAFLVGGGAVVAVYLLVFAFTGLSREERAFARSSLRALGGRLAPRGQAT